MGDIQQALSLRLSAPPRYKWFHSPVTTKFMTITHAFAVTVSASRAGVANGEVRFPNPPDWPHPPYSAVIQPPTPSLRPPGFRPSGL